MRNTKWVGERLEANLRLIDLFARNIHHGKHLGGEHFNISLFPYSINDGEWRFAILCNLTYLYMQYMVEIGC